ncbi:MAG: hypothetical protein JWQ40_1557 [Segetibacter sp.]|nr:hypothetical protein [Segetibacter sp.]
MQKEAKGEAAEAFGNNHLIRDLTWLRRITFILCTAIDLEFQRQW